MNVTLARPASTPATAAPAALPVLAALPAPSPHGAANASPAAVAVVVAAPAPTVTAGAASNVSDLNAKWAAQLGPQGNGYPTSQIEDMDASDFTFFAGKGTDAWVLKSPYQTFVGMGDDQEYPPNPIGADLSAAKYGDARKIRDVVMPKINAAGSKLILVTNLKNPKPANSSFIFTGIFPDGRRSDGSSVGGGTWLTDTSPSTVQRVKDWVSFALAVGVYGLMFDGEDYPANDSTKVAIWGSQEWVQQWRDRGYELGVGLAQANPDLRLFSYTNFLPGSAEEVVRGESFDPTGANVGYSNVNFWYGVTLGMADTAPTGQWCIQFCEATTYFRGPAYQGYRQLDINRVAAYLSKKWPHWWRVADRLAVQPFIWIDKGVYVGGVPNGNQDIPYSPSQLSSDKAVLRNWHMVTVNDPRVQQEFVYESDLKNQTLDCSPVTTWPTGYGTDLDYLSTPTVVANNPPGLTITAPANNSSTSASSITTVTGNASDDFGVVVVWWENDAFPVGNANRKGHVAMTWNPLSGSATTSFTWQLDLSLQGSGSPAGPIPLAVGVNNITFTARDSKGATTSVVRTVTRT